MDFFDESNNRAKTNAHISLLSDAINNTDGSNLVWQRAKNTNNNGKEEAIVAPRQNNQNNHSSIAGYLFDQSKSRILPSSHMHASSSSTNNTTNNNINIQNHSNNVKLTEEKVLVQHNYCDYAMVPNEKKSINTKGGVKVPFPIKLFDMLEHIDLQEPQLRNVISWQPHGRCFLVHDHKQFEELALPRFFKQQHYASFRRQLNLWGFKRITQSGPDSGAYYHELFLRSKTFLCRDIIRTTPGEGESSTRVPSNPEAEPKFYSMMALPPSGPGPSSSSSNTGSAKIPSASVSAQTSASAPSNLPVKAKDTNADPMATEAPESISAASKSQGKISGGSASPCLEAMHSLPTHGVEVGTDNAVNEALWSDKLPSGMSATHLSTANMTSMNDVRASNMSSLHDLQASISEIDYRTMLLQQMLMRNDRSSSMRQINEMRDMLSKKVSQSSVESQLQSQDFPASHPTDSRGENALDRSINEIRGGILSRNDMQSSIDSQMQSQGFPVNRQADGRAAAFDQSRQDMRGSMSSRNGTQSAFNSQPYSQGFPGSHSVNSREVALDRGINDRFNNQYGTNHYESVEPSAPQHSNFNRTDLLRSYPFGGSSQMLLQSDSFRSIDNASDKFQHSNFNRTDLLRSYPSFRSVSNASDKFQSSHFNRTDLLRSYPFGGSSQTLLRSDSSRSENNASDKLQSSNFNRTDLLRSYPFGGSSQTLLRSDDSFRSVNNASNNALDNFQSSNLNRTARSGSSQKLLRGLEEEICTGPEPVSFSEAVHALSPNDKGSLLDILTKIN